MKIEDAKPNQVTLLRGAIYGADGSGKSESLARLATGIVSVIGGHWGVVDTDNERSGLLADRFKFRRIRLKPDHSPSRIREAVEMLAADGCSLIAVDDMTVEHEGLGGYHEIYDEVVRRGVEKDPEKPEKTFSRQGWAAAKAARKPLVELFRQLPCHLILTFRGREKQADDYKSSLGWSPICGREYTRMLHFLACLPPGANGRPRWEPRLKNELDHIKLSHQLRPFPEQLDEATGARWARWATGKQEGPPELSTLAKDMIGQLDQCQSQGDKDQADEFINRGWNDLAGAHEGDAVTKAADDAYARISATEQVQQGNQ